MRPQAQRTGTLSRTQASTSDGLPVSTLLAPNSNDSDTPRPPYTVTAPATHAAALTTSGESPYPPPFSSLFFPSPGSVEAHNKPVEPTQREAPPEFAPAPPFTESASSAATAAATKAVLPRDPKASSSNKDLEDGEPPPPYTEGTSPLDSFTYLMASAGGPASIITQVSQTSQGPPINALAGGSDENITLELRHVVHNCHPEHVLTMLTEEHASHCPATSF